MVLIAEIHKKNIYIYIISHKLTKWSELIVFVWFGFETG